MVHAPGLLAANGLGADAAGAAALRVDLDAEGRMRGIEVLWPAVQLPRALEAGGREDRVLDRRGSEAGAVRIVLDADSAQVAVAAVRHVAGGEPPRLCFDGEGRLTAIDVPEPGLQLPRELLE